MEKLFLGNAFKAPKGEPPPDTTRWCTSTEFADASGISNGSLHHQIELGYIRGVLRNGRMAMIPRSELQRCAPIARALRAERVAAGKQRARTRTVQPKPLFSPDVFQGEGPLLDRINYIAKQVDYLVQQSKDSHDHSARDEGRRANTNGSGEAGNGDSAAESESAYRL